MSLKNILAKYADQGYLKQEKIGLDQIRALLAGATKNLIASKKNITIDEETCFAMAYYAMLKLSRAIIYLNGFRPNNGRQHKTAVEVSGLILGKNFEMLIKKFDKMRRKRNQFTYDPLMPLSREEAKNALKTASDFYKEVEKYLIKKDPQKRLFE